MNNTRADLSPTAAPARVETDTRTWTEKFGEKRNKRRRLALEQNPHLREARREEDRLRYRQHNGVVLWSCSVRLPVLEAYGASRSARIPDSMFLGERVTFTMEELAELVGDHKAPVIYRWRSRGILPHPFFKADVWLDTSGKAGTYKADQDVYLLEEVRAIVEILGDHQSRFRYYRISDTETVLRIFAAVKAARDNIIASA